MAAKPQVVHVVLFKWKADAAPTDIAKVVAGLQALAKEIPGILELSCGENFSTRSQGFHTGLVVRFVDRDALEEYGPHPSHQAVVLNLISPIREDTIAIDYEI